LDQAAYGLHAAALNPPEMLSEYLETREPTPTVGEGERVAFSRLHPIWQDPFLMRGLRTMQGYVSLAPRKSLTFDTPNSMRVAGVGWVSRATAKDGQAWEKATTAPLPRARLVTRTQASTDPRRDLELIDPGTTALTVR